MSSFLPPGVLQPAFFGCTICNKTVLGQPITIATEHICPKCFNEKIQPRFLRALRNDHARPVTWRGNELTIEDHRKDLPIFVRLQWNEREKKRDQPREEHLYCKGELPQPSNGGGRGGTCYNFLGLKTRSVGLNACHGCGSTVCSRCGGILKSSKGEKYKHICPDMMEREEGMRQGPTAGKDATKKKTKQDGDPGALFPLADTDVAKAGIMTTDERKERMFAWLEALEVKAPAEDDIVWDPPGIYASVRPTTYVDPDPRPLTPLEPKGGWTTWDGPYEQHQQTADEEQESVDSLLR